MMIKRKVGQAPKPNSLPQQQSDFTAEGSPPPGKVAAAGPESPKKAAALPAKAAAVRKGPPANKSRWQR